MKTKIAFVSLAVSFAAFFVTADPASAQVFASDDAGGYTNPPNNSAWISMGTANGGFGFTPWVFRDTPTTSSNYSGFYVGNPGNIGVSNNSWGMYANGAPTNVAVAFRGFTNGVPTNAAFRLKWQTHGIGFSNYNFAGLSLRNGNASAAINDYTTGERFAFFYRGGGTDNATIRDASGENPFPELSYADIASGITMDVIPLPVNRYRLVFRDASGSNTIASFNHRQLAGSGPIQSVALYASQTDGDQNFNSMEIAAVPNFRLAIQPGSNSVTISWPDFGGPYTLQIKTNISDAAWRDVLTTLALKVSLPFTGGSTFYRLILPEIPIDPTDYDRDRPAIAQFYTNDVKSYWVHYGIPPLCRLSDILQGQAQNPTNAFGGLLTGFDQPAFNSAMASGLLPLEFSNHVAGFQMAGQITSEALINTFRLFVNELDTVQVQQGTNAPRVLELFQMFDSVFTQAFHTNWLAPLAPQASKQFIGTIITNRNDWVDLHATDAFTTNVPPLAPPPDDTNTTTHTRWEQITTSSVWKTTYNGACAAVANGASMAKLDPKNFPADTTCKFWNDFSKLIGGAPGQVGGNWNLVGNYYASLGYSCTEARDGNAQTAVEEAKAALDRGCDVTIGYISSDNTQAHEEMVQQITILPDNPQHATVDTLSWGQRSSVDYNNGTFSGKTDGLRYGANGYLKGKGRAFFRYYCKKG